MKEVVFIFLFILSGGELWEPGNSARISCKTCKKFVTEFGKGFDATANSNFAGGDTSWEEENQGAYSDSEVRVVEILDGVCDRSDYKCNSLLEEAEEDIERWWLKLRKKEGKGDLRTWLCDSHLDVCCPENTFGSSCQPCPGGVDNVCGGRGKCEGSEEKDGSGKCECDDGYSGDICQACAERFFPEVPAVAEGDETPEPPKLECKACDKSCNQSCDGPGAGDCDSCAKGYTESEEGVCEDFDECKSDGDTRCKDGTYCYNTPGSHRCNDCDKSCKKICNGPGPSKCAECAKGYTRNEHGVCRDDDECSEEGGANCKEGTYCENTPGKYVCKACHISCLSGCHGEGAKSCVACKEGYTMSEEDGCKDIDECAESAGDPAGPCDPETEVCHNLLGTYVCNCQGDLVKGEDGRCVEEEVRKNQRKEKREKEKKKKRKKKKKKASKTVVLSEEEREEREEPREEERERREEPREGGHIPQGNKVTGGGSEGVGVVVDGSVVDGNGIVDGVGVLENGGGVVDDMGMVNDGGVISSEALAMMDTGEDWEGGVVSEGGDGGVVSDITESHDEL